MNTIERVARGIRDNGFPEDGNCYVYWSADDLDVTLDGGFDTKLMAKAALEALCEGLEWQGDALRYNHVLLGCVTHDTNGEWVWEFGVVSLHGREYRPDKESARAALVARARNWIMGLETVTEKG